MHKKSNRVYFQDGPWAGSIVTVTSPLSRYYIVTDKNGDKVTYAINPENRSARVVKRDPDA